MKTNAPSFKKARNNVVFRVAGYSPPTSTEHAAKLRSQLKLIWSNDPSYKVQPDQAEPVRTIKPRVTVRVKIQYEFQF